MATPIDLSRETAQIRSSPIPGNNWIAAALNKIQTGFRDIQQTHVTTQNVQQAVQQSLVITVVPGTTYTAQYTDNVIIAIAASTTSVIVTITFPVQKGKPKLWYVLSTGSNAQVNFQASTGSVLGALHMLTGASGIVVTDGANLICGS